MRRGRGRLVGIVVVLTLAATIGAPFYVRALRIWSNERNASAALKNLADAELEFRSNDFDDNRISDFWTGDVARLHRGGLIPREVAEADANPLDPLVATPRPYNGYLFVALNTCVIDGLMEPYRQDTGGTPEMGNVHNYSYFGFCAYPAEYGVTGRLTFVINEGNTMYKLDTGGEPVLRWPEPQSSGID